MDIMIDKYGEAGTVRYGIDGAFNVALLKVVPLEKTQKEYIRDFLLQPKIKDILFMSSQASTRPSLNESTFTALKIPMITDSLMSEYQNKAEKFLLFELRTTEEIEKLRKIKKQLLSKYF